VANYTYVAYELSGRRLTGTVVATDPGAAMQSISATGAQVLELKEARNATAALSTNGRGRAPRSELALFSRRLSDLATAGIPLDRALQIAGGQSSSPVLRSVTVQALEDVHAGLPISEALAKHPALFPPVFTMTLRAGEASGQFPQVVSRLAELQQMEVRRRSQLSGAMIYPLVLAVTSVGVITFLMLFVVPRLSGVFKDLKGDLPASTRILMLSSGFLMSHIVSILAGILAVILAYRAWSSTEAGATTRDQWLLKLPVVGPVIEKAAVSRYTRVLSTLLYGGVPILESLRIAAATAGNRILTKGSDNVQKRVREGSRVADALRDSGTFSDLLVQMVAVGEETGDLPTMLTRVSDTYDFEVDTGIQKAMSLLEPIMVLGMGAFVGFVVLSILLPVYQAQDLIK
jgi:type II secretory pathway component PulF